MEIITSYFANYINLDLTDYKVYSITKGSPFYLPVLDFLCYSPFCLSLRNQERYEDLKREYNRLLKLNNSLDRLYEICKRDKNIILLSWSKDDTYCNRRVIREKMGKKKYQVNAVEFSSVLDLV